MLVFDKRRDFIFQMKLDIPSFDAANENWEPNSTAYGQTDFNNRYTIRNINDPNFKTVVDYFFTMEFKDSIVDALYSAPLFAGYWSIGPDKMKSITKTFGTAVQDRPGHTTALHLDNRLLVATGMCYLIDGDDEQQSTIFYTDDKYSNPLRMHTGWGKGWLAANMHDSWHEGFNRSNNNRHSILFGLSLVY